MAEIIDSHHHVWLYSPEQYGWISPEMKVLKRDFLPGHMATEMRASGVDGAIVVQAQSSVDETKWMLALAEQDSFIRGVVGWLPIAEGDLTPALEEFKGNKTLKGLRHSIQDEPDDFMDNPAFNEGIASLAGTGLVYDIVVHGRQLPHVDRFVKRHPQQIFVLDHLGKPGIRAHETEPWRSDLTHMAKRENVYCKLSGLVTEADWTAWTPDNLKPYLDVALDAFGPDRLMAGSDWPVCLVASNYKRWWDVIRDWTSDLSATDRDKILGGNAVKVYRLGEA